MWLGRPGQIVTLDSVHNQRALVEAGGARRQVNLASPVDEAHAPHGCSGDWVLVRVGFALNRINQQKTAETLPLLSELGEVQAALAARRVPGEKVIS